MGYSLPVERPAARNDYILFQIFLWINPLGCTESHAEREDYFITANCSGPEPNHLQYMRRVIYREDKATGNMQKRLDEKDWLIQAMLRAMGGGCQSVARLDGWSNFAAEKKKRTPRGAIQDIARIIQRCQG